MALLSAPWNVSRAYKVVKHMTIAQIPGSTRAVVDDAVSSARRLRPDERSARVEKALTVVLGIPRRAYRRLSGASTEELPPSINELAPINASRRPWVGKKTQKRPHFALKRTLVSLKEFPQPVASETRICSGVFDLDQ